MLEIALEWFYCIVGENFGDISILDFSDLKF